MRGAQPRRGHLRRRLRRRRSPTTRRDTGKPAVPPPSELALIKWRDVVDGPAQVLEDVTRLRAADVPLGWVLVDNPWETCIGTLTFDPTRFPDPAGLIRQVHALGVQLHALGLAEDAAAPSATRRSCSAIRPTSSCSTCGSRRSSRSSSAARQARRARRRRRQGRPRRRGRPRGRWPDPAERLPAPLRARRHGRAAARRAAIFRAGDGRLAGGRAGALGRRPAERAASACSARSSPAQTAAMSGFPTWGSDVGGYSLAGADRRALRALGAARRRLAGDGGRRRRARTRRRGRSAPMR